MSFELLSLGQLASSRFLTYDFRLLTSQLAKRLPYPLALSLSSLYTPSPYVKLRAQPDARGRADEQAPRRIDPHEQARPPSPPQ